MDDKILFRLSKADHQIKTHIKRELAAQNIRLSAGQTGVLFLLKQNGLHKMSELGTRLEIDNSAITRIVDALEKKNLVNRQPNPADRREIRIGLTEKGLKETVLAETIARQTNQAIKDGFSDQEIKLFLKVLESCEKKFKTPSPKEA